MTETEAQVPGTIRSIELSNAKILALRAERMTGYIKKTVLDGRGSATERHAAKLELRACDNLLEEAHAELAMHETKLKQLAAKLTDEAAFMRRVEAAIAAMPARNPDLAAAVEAQKAYAAGNTGLAAVFAAVHPNWRPAI